MSGQRYQSFISYARVDERWASRLQKRLEAFRLPRGVQAAEGHSGQRPLGPVFRDRSDLTAAASLTTAIRSALQQSDALILICSPRAAASEWVGEEIESFLAERPIDRIFCLIVDGDPEGEPGASCFPPALLAHCDDDPPLAADVREDGFADAFLRLAAGLLGLPYDTLKRRELARRRKRQLVLTGASLTLTAVMTGLATVSFLARQDAERRREQAEALVGFMLGDLRERLTDIGRLDVLDGVGSAATDYFSSLSPSDVRGSTLEQHGMALRQIGEVRVAQGDFRAGLDLFEQSLAMLTRASHHPDALPSTRFELAMAHFWIADAHYRQSDYATAERFIQDYRRILEGVVAEAPDQLDYRAELQSAENNIGVLRLYDGNTEAARRHLDRAMALGQELIERAPDEHRYHEYLAETLSWQSSLAESAEGFEAALAWREREARRRSEALALQDSPEGRRRRLSVLSHAARLHHATGALARASALQAEAIDGTRDLVAYDPDNAEWRRGFYLALAAGARYRLAACDLAGAAAQLEELGDGWQTLLAIDDSDLGIRTDALAAEVLGSQLDFLSGERKIAVEQARDALAAHRALQDRGVTDEYHARSLALAALIVATGQARTDPAAAAGTARTALAALAETTLSLPEARALAAELHRVAGDPAEAASITASLAALGYGAGRPRLACEGASQAMAR